MHSATKSALKAQNLIETIRANVDTDFDTYQGRRVIVDDGCPFADGVYTTYLFGQGGLWCRQSNWSYWSRRRS